MNELRIRVFMLFCMISSLSVSAGSILDDFRVSLIKAELTDFTERSLKLESLSPTYSIMLEPNASGPVAFALGRHAIRSTVVPPNLFFGVRIEGFKNGKLVLPSFTIDESYEDLHIDSSFVVFRHIFAPIPVLFESGVDSIRLRFSNSHKYNFHQYFTISELQILGKTETLSNPDLIDCENHSIMIAIQGSNSIDKAERKTISKELMALFKNPASKLDSNEVCIMEFGKKVSSISESAEKKEIVSSIKSYKKAGKQATAKSGHANWGAALDQALEKKPDIFIMVTNSWSNYGNQGPSSINAQHAELVAKCNKLKTNGTRLLFITSGLYDESKSNMTLLSMLNQESTSKLIAEQQQAGFDLKSVDLIAMDGFENFKLIDLSSLIQCTQESVAEH